MRACPKNPPLRDREYLDYLCTQPCLITGHHATEYEAVDPCHIGTAGTRLKSPDNEALPFSHMFHAQMHNGGEMSVLRRNLPNSILRLMLRAYAREKYEEWRDSNGK